MRSLELFSGAGGLALGLEKAGFHSIALVERDKNACATLRHNRPNWNVLSDDVRNIHFGELGPVELVAGGPPCQPFSMGGKANGYDDHRDMFPQAVHAVRELQPLAFVFENVRGLLRPGFRNYVEYIRLQLTYPDFPISANVDWMKNFQRLERHHTSRSSDHGLSYKVTINLANAANFGVPQHRHRVFFIGFRMDLNARWFFPTETHSSDELLFEQYVTGSYWKRHGLKKPANIPDPLKAKIKDLERGLLSTTKPWQTVRDAVTDLGDPRIKSTFMNHQYQRGARSYPGHTGSPLDEPSKALKAGDHGVPGGENMLRYPNGKVRYFSIREAARIQTFPDEFEFPGSWTESMRQLGNAVPVRLASTVISSVGKTLREHVKAEAVQSNCNS